MRSSFVYIVASHKNGQISTGITFDLVQRIWQHRSGQIAQSDASTACAQLVWYAEFDSPEEAQAELDRLSRWPDAWTLRLIEDSNPDWTDLWASLEDQPKIGINPVNQYLSSPPPPIIRPMRQVA